ncbi:MAG: hypothetical protein NZ519_01990 [Bacteroidia bacterium]|nr:hypothetical protein [Bacteroidia bacterium]MDW8300918.1 hypothetical protein [Bacteroidia bacterium]
MGVPLPHKRKRSVTKGGVLQATCGMPPTLAQQGKRPKINF